MKTGTFSCWLWGHKFIIERDSIEKIEGRSYKTTSYKVSNYCSRCGINRLKNT